MSRTDEKMGTTTVGLPSQIRTLRVMTGVQIYRFVGLSLILYSSSLPSAFLLPVVAGDTLTAVFAPVIVLAIGKKRGPRTWAAALVWNVLGMTDLFYALTIGQLTTAGSVVLANDPGVVIGTIVGLTLHITSIALLLRKANVSYLIGSR